MKHLPEASSQGFEGHSVARAWEERASRGKGAPGVRQVLGSDFSFYTFKMFDYVRVPSAERAGMGRKGAKELLCKPCFPVARSPWIIVIFSFG